MKKPNRKDLFYYLCKAISALEQWQYDNSSDKYRELLDKLDEIRHGFTFSGTKWMTENLQDLTLWWTGQDEEDFNCLKLLRMKSFGTI